MKKTILSLFLVLLLSSCAKLHEYKSAPVTIGMTPQQKIESYQEMVNHYNNLIAIEREKIAKQAK